MKTSVEVKTVTYRRHRISFYHAFEGIRNAFATQPNLRVHFFFALSAVILGTFLNLTGIEWLVLLLTILMVLTTEMVNTSIEAAVDLFVDKQDPLAKIAKDASAGAVLITAVGSAIIGLVLFLPHFF